MRFESPRIHFNRSRSGPPRPAMNFGRRPLRLSRSGLRYASTALTLRSHEHLKPISDSAEPRPTGYDKYDRRFTQEGGIKLQYRDVERTLPIILGKMSLGCAALVLTYYAGAAWSPIEGFWWNVLAYILLACVYAFILLRDKQVQRTIEIRPDCMIIEGMDVFWKEYMPLGWPGFQPNDAGHFVLGGVYGSRWVEFLTIRRFDDNDRAPEVFAAQLAAAMTTQWELPSKGV